MAKSTKSVSFSKAMLDVVDGAITITEYTKDDTKVYDLLKILQEFNGVENISLTIKTDDEIETIEE